MEEDVEELIEGRIDKISKEIDEIKEREDRTPATHVAIRNELTHLLKEVRSP